MYLGADAGARVACETLCTTNLVVIAGEVRGPDSIGTDDIESAVRDAIRDIGYEQSGFHWKNANIQVHLHKQSTDIAQGVDAAGNKDEGAGDQGLMFGYACRETPVLMPAPIHFSHRILKRMAEARHAGSTPGLGPDSKSQVTLRYEDGEPVAATSVVVSTQHDASLGQEEVRELVRPFVEEVLPNGWMCPEEEFYVNPTGRFVIGGPDGDCGLTGRKIIVDTYGGAALHGGGAFSGKDPSQGRSIRRVRRALRRQERRRGRLGRALHHPGRLCHRGIQAPVGLRRYRRHRKGRRVEALGGDPGSGRLVAGEASASGLASAGRSTAAPRRTVTSAGSPSPMADFPGNGPIWFPTSRVHSALELRTGGARPRPAGEDSAAVMRQRRLSLACGNGVGPEFGRRREVPNSNRIEAFLWGVSRGTRRGVCGVPPRIRIIDEV